MSIKGWSPKNKFGSDIMHLYNGHGDNSGIFFDMIFFKEYLEEFDKYINDLKNKIKQSDFYKEIGYLNPSEENIIYNFKPLMLNSLFVSCFSYFESKLYEISSICSHHLSLERLSKFKDSERKNRITPALIYIKFLRNKVGLSLNDIDEKLNFYKDVRNYIMHQDLDSKQKNISLEKLKTDKDLSIISFTLDDESVLIVQGTFVQRFIELISEKLKDIMDQIKIKYDLMEYVDTSK